MIGYLKENPRLSNKLNGRVLQDSCCHAHQAVPLADIHHALLPFPAITMILYLAIVRLYGGVPDGEIITLQFSARSP